ILFPWIGVAVCGCYLAGSFRQPGEPTAMLWEAFLAVPLVIAAALGFIEIADRRIGCEMALAAGLLALANGTFVTAWTAPEGSEFVEAGPASLAFEHPLIVVVVLGVLGLALARVARRDETRRRGVMAVVLSLIVLANCWWGA